ncbi:4'-phosphopantetheinyl transferase superfamily protein [Mesobacillus maritimus]|uniref:4'-phosphopantetheinyl transferase family protein n=1 Tax=Mesobacillus maritimus TaxID=1643336 RepID=UPI00203E7D08|nr:4'-phosphopantetheinyl transferase superfamily protein [Mesobacillus maritimus]MCM3670695.1 4'-phosphopantetheinyl transferase superfamily protein [Mesobacillus maritimus]
MLEIYALRLPDHVPNFHSILGTISPRKKEKITSFRNLQDSYRSLLSEILTRTYIQKYLQLKDKNISFSYNEFGKPYIENVPFYFNTSHSGDWVVGIFGNDEVGIDIEKIKEIDFDIARHFFSTNECQDLEQKNQHDKLYYFYDLWTLKESFIKNIGTGLSFSLNSFTVQKREGTITISHPLQGTSVYFKQYELDEFHILSACARTKDFPQAIQIIEAADLLQDYAISII